MSKKCVVFDEYNDIINITNLKSNEEILIQKTITKSQKKYLISKTKLNEFNKNNGGFIFMYVKKNEVLFNKLNLKPANITRLIYLATYIDYNTNQENLLVLNENGKKTKPITRDEMMKLLKLKRSGFEDFLKDLKNNNLIYEVDDKFYITNEYFSKGKCPFDKKQYVRLYITPIRDLYNNCKPTQHKVLSYAFRLLPKLNYHTNIICQNPLDKNAQGMSLKEIGVFLGIYDTGNQSKLKKNLFSLYITRSDRKYHIFYRVITEGENHKQDYFVVNPVLCWGGSCTEQALKTFNNLIKK